MLVVKQKRHLLTEIHGWGMKVGSRTVFQCSTKRSHQWLAGELVRTGVGYVEKKLFSYLALTL